jgi:hypothetical protein
MSYPDMTCVRCHKVVPARLIDFEHDGAVCRSCIIAAHSDPAEIARGERELLRSIGTRQVVIGFVMLAIGIAILTLGLDSNSTVVLVPTGFLLGGLFELVRGFGNLNRSPG